MILIKYFRICKYAYIFYDTLILDDNNLSGIIPSKLGWLSNLKVIALCKYGRRVDLCLEEHGVNPSSTSNFVFFPLLHDKLFLDDNNLSGSVPSELFALPNLKSGFMPYDKGIQVGK